VTLDAQRLGPVVRWINSARAAEDNKLLYNVHMPSIRDKSTIASV